MNYEDLIININEEDVLETEIMINENEEEIGNILED